MNSLQQARWSALGIGLLIIAGSSVPGSNIPKAFQLTPDKLIHCVEYFVLGIFLFRWSRLEFFSKRYNLLLTLVIGSLFGALDESYQRLIPGRTPDLWDWVLDTIGVGLSVIMAVFIWPSSLTKKP
ncbi:MAG: VanZ family protein [Cyclobacteriaceae bacterium]|nr:VanZ family protein [Cyclobacteriaceae bacterium]